MLLKRFYDEKLAQASYMVGCQATGEALVVDANRNFEQFLEAAEQEGLRITAVSETHIHADFASGSRELATLTGAKLYLSDEGGEDWKYAFAKEAGATLLKGGDSFWVGNVRIDAIHTPGHTPEHLSFAVTDTPATDKVMGVLTGDFVFVGDVGRPDLLERAAGHEGTMEAAGRSLFKSLQNFKKFEDYVQIWPGHGAGSACGKGLGAIPSSTVGYERLVNWAFKIEDEAEFVEAVLAGQPEAPVYFATMKRINKEGPAYRSDFAAPKELSVDALIEILAVDENGDAKGVVVDTRSVQAFACAHVPGTLNIALGRAFTNWAGWLLPYDRPVYVVVEEGNLEALDDVVLSLATIGIDRVEGYFTDEIFEKWSEKTGHSLEGIERLTIDEAEKRLKQHDFSVIDVRGELERDAGYVPGTRHIPLGYLTKRLAELPADQAIGVHCQGGTRSPIAASLLKAHGIKNVFDMNAGFAGWKAAGKEVVIPKK